MNQPLLVLAALGIGFSGCDQISRAATTGGTNTGTGGSSTSTGSASATATTGQSGSSTGSSTSASTSASATGTSSSTAGSGGTSTGSSSGGTTGPAGPFCKSVGGPCTGSQGDCCTDLSCQDGTCLQPAPICAGNSEPCSTSVHCCEPADGGALLTCTGLNDAGLSLCLSPTDGDACGSDADCPAPYTCVSSSCGLAQTSASCNNPADPGYHTPCQVGDACIVSHTELFVIEQNGLSADPCIASGLVCVFLGQDGICVTPSVSATEAWSPDGPPYDTTFCNPKEPTCASYYTGADRTAPVCGPFILPEISGGPANRCEETCTSGDDCDSVALDCIEGQCKPNYCYSDAIDTSQLSTAQVAYGGLAISSDPKVLFASCATGDGFPTACLPEYDQLTNGTSGICVRVAGDGGGTWGDPCDPGFDRNDLAGLCQFGNLCALGTCMPWCDLDNVSCPSGTDCQPVPSGPLTSITTGTTHSIGVCAQTCDPYLDSTQNGCQPFPIDAGQPPLGCKFSGNGSDTSPPAGNCVALVDAPIAVGLPCQPFGWLDPCVSGAQCIQEEDAGAAFVCRQLCDPEVSSDVTIQVPACPVGQTCQPLQMCPLAGGACAHEGDCQ